MRKALLEGFNRVKDPRMVNKCDHKLCDILFIALCTLICNGEDFEDMVSFGQERIEWLKTILELPNGIPSHDTFNRVFQRIEPQTLSEILKNEGQALLDCIEEKQICIDGKKIKGVYPHKKGNQGLYILNAWVSENRLCLGQRKVDDKSNEIKAIPELLDSLDIKGAVVSIDAMGCQKSIATKIMNQSGDYFLALKNNQKETYQKVEECFRFHEPVDIDVVEGKDHGREERRKCSILSVKSLPQEQIPSEWQGLQSLVKIESLRRIKGISQEQVRYYLSSESMEKAHYFNLLARGHWGIENQLHWHLDVSFKEDASRARSGNVPLNMNILRKIALQRIDQMKDNLSKKKRRYKASLSNEYLIQIL